MNANTLKSDVKFSVFHCFCCVIAFKAQIFNALQVQFDM